MIGKNKNPAMKEKSQLFVEMFILEVILISSITINQLLNNSLQALLQTELKKDIQE